jgi:hypothetical protein
VLPGIAATGKAGVHIGAAIDIGNLHPRPDEYRISRDDRGGGFAFGLERLAEVCAARPVPSSVEPPVGRVERRHHDVQDRQPPYRPVPHSGGISTAPPEARSACWCRL